MRDCLPDIETHGGDRMRQEQWTLGAPAARRSDLERFVTDEGLGWTIVAEGAGALNVAADSKAGAPCTLGVLHPGGRIDCSIALALADRSGAPSEAIGRLMNLLGIRIRNCQLGCFQ
jgi:hypothetical protein